MQVSEDDLRAAAKAGVVRNSDLERLIDFLDSRKSSEPSNSVAPAPRFDTAHLLWYAGALIVIGAMGLFSTLAFSQMGGNALTACALIYAAVFSFAGNYLWNNKGLKTPGGLLIAIAVSMAPLAVFGVQEATGWWGTYGAPGTVQDFYTWIKGSWVLMELSAIAAGIVALRFYRFPFIVLIISVALWFLSMDLTPWVFGTEAFDWEMRRKVSVWFGLGVLLVAWIVDHRQSGGDFAFWLHLFGLMAFWGGITLTGSSSELAKALYCLLNIGLIVFAVLLMRRAYLVFGAIGVSTYLGHLAYEVFEDSLLFPFALSAIGVMLIAAGLLYYRKQQEISAWLISQLPKVLLQLRPAHAREKSTS